MRNNAHPRAIDHGFPKDEREWPTFDDIANATYGPPSPPTISVTEAARMLGISRTTAYEAVRDGTLPSIRIDWRSRTTEWEIGSNDGNLSDVAGAPAWSSDSAMVFVPRSGFYGSPSMLVELHPATGTSNTKASRIDPAIRSLPVAAVQGAFLRDNRTILAATIGGQIIRVDVATGQQVGPGVEAGINAPFISIRPGGRWAILKGSQLMELSLVSNPNVGSPIPDSAQAFFAGPTSNGGVLIEEVANGALQSRLLDASGKETARVAGIIVELRGFGVLTVKQDGAASLRRAPGHVAWSTRLPGGLAPRISFSLQASALIQQRASGEFDFYNLRTGRAIKQAFIRLDPNDVTAFTISSDAKTLAIAEGKERRVVLLDPRTGKSRGAPITDVDYPTALSFARSGTTLYYGTAGGVVGTIDIATGKQRNANVKGQSQAVTGVWESADGSTVGTNGAEGTFRLFDAGSLTQLGEPLALRLGSFAGTDDAFNRVALPTPTGVRMFDLRRTSMLGAACARAGQNLSRTSWSQFFPGEPYRATCVDIAQDRDPHRAKR